jgi:5-methylthioadenosine/S-adenosylhomocysteine deaminase
MATLGGATALGMDDRIGSLEAGKLADLITVRMDRTRHTPLYDPISHLVYTTRGDDVDTTIVHGRVLMRGRVVRTLDGAAVRAEARAAADQVRAAVRK